MDITALSALIPANGVLNWFFWGWISEKAAETYIKKHNIRYDLWEDIEIVQGNTIDYSLVERKITELNNDFVVKWVEYDPWNSIDLALRLQENHGIEVNKNRQGYALSYPLKQLQSKIIGGEVVINESECLRWMFDNTMIKTNDKLDIQVSKSKEYNNYKKVDGVVSGAMAMNGYLNDDHQEVQTIEFW
jgi:phage terminase large subunit-like protein